MEYKIAGQEPLQLHESVAEKRNYRVLNVGDARKAATAWLEKVDLEGAIEFGLPEIDDRYHLWRVPLVGKDSKERVGEAVIDAYTSLLLEDKSTSADILEDRLLHREPSRRKKSKTQKVYKRSSLRNTIALGDAEEILRELPSESIDLIFTSPPHYCTHPEYQHDVAYEEYLLKIRRIVRACHTVLNEGRFFVINISPVLIQHTKHSKFSKRIAVPFDMHRLFVEEHFDFIDDIIWVKPEETSWSTENGSVFATHRNPLQYEAMPAAEYILIYRKQSERLIDWNIKAHHDLELVKESRVADGYEKTNVWQIKPTYSKEHPTVFPEELASKVITYYSFKDDVVLDPFSGSGTVGAAATKLQRRFVLIDQEPNYVKLMRDRAKKWLGKEAADILCLNCASII